MPKILDFGLAKISGGTESAQGDQFETSYRQVVGTPAYMSPEQARGENHRIGFATDIFSLGTILYQLLTGELPFASPSLTETLSLIMHASPRPLRQLRPEIPRDLEAICLRCLEKSQAGRYPSAADFAADLERYLRGEAVLGSTWRGSRFGRLEEEPPGPPLGVLGPRLASAWCAEMSRRLTRAKQWLTACGQAPVPRYSSPRAIAAEPPLELASCRGWRHRVWTRRDLPPVPRSGSELFQTNASRRRLQTAKSRSRPAGGVIWTSWTCSGGGRGSRIDVRGRVRRIQQVQVPGRADVEDRDVPLPVSDHLDSHAIAGVETDLVGRLRNLLHVPCQTPRLGGSAAMGTNASGPTWWRLTSSRRFTGWQELSPC